MNVPIWTAAAIAAAVFAWAANARFAASEN